VSAVDMKNVRKIWWRMV